jgi:hypothetical protein
MHALKSGLLCVGDGEAEVVSLGLSLLLGVSPRSPQPVKVKAAARVITARRAVFFTAPPPEFGFQNPVARGPRVTLIPDRGRRGALLVKTTKL